jgi:hypothetical protein
MPNAPQPTCDVARSRRYCELAFIGGKTNRQIGDKQPSEYFPALMDGVQAE